VPFRRSTVHYSKRNKTKPMGDYNRDAKREKERLCVCWVGARAAARQPRFRGRSGSQVRHLDRRMRWASDGGIDCRKEMVERKRIEVKRGDSREPWRIATRYVAGESMSSLRDKAVVTAAIGCSGCRKLAWGEGNQYVIYRSLVTGYGSPA
jgi:hypothetical protein